MFDYLVEHSPIVLYDFHTYLTKNETEFERVCGNCVPVSDVPLTVCPERLSTVPEKNGTYLGVADQNATPAPVTTPDTDQGATSAPVTTPNTDQGATSAPVTTPNTDEGATSAPVTTPNTDQLETPAPVATTPASVVSATVVADANEKTLLPVRVSTLTSDQLISRYGETVFTMRIKGKSGVSCVKFLFEIYGIKAQKCTPTCTFKHSLDYDFGVPIGFIFREYGKYTYYYRKMHGHKPVVFQFATSDIDKFASGFTEIVPIGTYTELRGALKNLFLN